MSVTVTLTAPTGNNPGGDMLRVSTGVPYAMPFAATIDSETVLVTSGGQGDSWTVVRGYNLTAPASHAAGATVTPVAATLA